MSKPIARITFDEDPEGTLEFLAEQFDATIVAQAARTAVLEALRRSKTHEQAAQAAHDAVLAALGALERE